MPLPLGVLDLTISSVRTFQLLFSRIRVQIPLLDLPSNIHVVTELALAPFFTFAHLEELTQ